MYRVDRLNQGDLLPPLTLPDVAGEMVRTSDFRGRFNLLLFLTHPPGCALCEETLQELDQSLARRDSDTTRILVIVPGAAAKVRAMKQRLALSIPVLVDAGAVLGNGATMIVTDRFGEVFSISRADEQHRLLTAAQLAEELAFVTLQCPE